MSIDSCLVLDPRLAWLDAIRRYPAADAEERERQQRFLSFIASQDAPASRATLVGHLTASAWLVSGDGRRVLLTHHRKLGRWLQLGGHIDAAETDLAQAALREAEEESGLSGLAVDTAIFDLDDHLIPARGAEPAHVHYDLRYVVRAGIDEDFRISPESLDLAWVDIANLAAAIDTETSLRRMAQRWLSQLR